MSLRDWTVTKKSEVRNKKMTIKGLLSCLNNATDCLWTPCYVKETSQCLFKLLLIWYSAPCKESSENSQFIQTLLTDDREIS